MTKVYFEKNGHSELVAIIEDSIYEKVYMHFEQLATHEGAILTESIENDINLELIDHFPHIAAIILMDL